MRCACCREARGATYQTRINGRDVRVRLCPVCANAQHGPSQCRLCQALVWRCATLAHFADAHPLTLARVTNDPANERYGIIGQPVPEPAQQVIGHVGFTPDGGLPE